MSEDIKKATGRPRKYAELEDKKLPKVEVSSNVATTSSDLKHTALSIVKDDTNHWCVYSFKFNPNTKEVVFHEVVKKNLRKDVAVMEFKRKAVEFIK